MHHQTKDLQQQIETGKDLRHYSNQLNDFGVKGLISHPERELMFMKGKTIEYLSNISQDETKRTIVKICAEIFLVNGINLNPMSMQGLAESIIRDWPFSKLSDIVVAIKMGCAGRFGRISWGEFHFSEVTGVDGWISKYEDWKTSQREQRQKIHRAEYESTHEGLMSEMNRKIEEKRKARETHKKRITLNDIENLDELRGQWAEQVKGTGYPEKEYIRAKEQELLWNLNKEQ